MTRFRPYYSSDFLWNFHATRSSFKPIPPPHLRYIAWILAKPSLIQINYELLDTMEFKFVVFDALLVEKLNFEVMFSVVVAMKTVRVMIPVQK